MDYLNQLFERVVGQVFVTLVEPVFFELGLMSWAERAFNATAFFVAGLVQVIAVAAICIPLERLFPVERSPDHTATLWSADRTDVIFTLVNKLGIVPLFAFALLYELLTPLESWLRLHGFSFWSLESSFPALIQWPLLSVLCYLLIIDFSEYWRHRLQHRINWWWQLHSLHHAQQRMTFWTDDRNHFIDEMIGALWLALIALMIGVPPQQFPLIVFASKFIESLSHANLRWRFGPLRYLLVSPQFHRIHHSIDQDAQGANNGSNFAAVFAFWDHLFGTASNLNVYPRTGIEDQASGRNYGRGFWESQWLGLLRLLGLDTAVKNQR